MTPSNSPFGIWDAADPADYAAWLAHWSAWPAREVAAHPAYARLFTDAPRDRALAAYWKSPHGCVLFPFVRRDLSAEPCWHPSLGRCADTVSPYGYGGPFTWGDKSATLADEFWQAFDRWARDERIVSEFVRMSLFDDALLPYPGMRVEKLTNVVCDLAVDETVLWERMKPKVRRNVKKAEREGVSIVCDECGDSADEFRRLYTATMDRRGANSRYYFSADFFARLQVGLAGQFAYFHALHAGRPISTELVLISAESVYFFLGGSDEAYYALRPNELLKFRIMQWAQERGKRFYVLGGGYAEGDGIFQYKQAFAPDGLVPFYVGQRVLDRTTYDELVRRRATTAANAPNYFPAYRAA